jgi:hypothetical protein
MTIGTIVDGQAEALSYPYLFKRIAIRGVSLLSPIYADMQPKATPAQIVKAAASRLNLAVARGADRQLVLLDLEDRKECPGDFAEAITKALHAAGFVNAMALVKRTCFENWLVADPDALSEMPARFDVQEWFRNAVIPNKADSVKAESLLARICHKDSYNKRSDPPRILSRAHPERIARNSRSFRRFLRLIGHPNYKSQSRSPLP